MDFAIADNSTFVDQINEVLPRAELDKLPLASRHQTLAKGIRALEQVEVYDLIKSELRSADVAFLVRSTQRLDWAIDALCTSEDGTRPLALLDTRIENAAIRVFCAHWKSSTDGLSKIRKLLKKHFVDNDDNGQGSSSSEDYLHRLYNTLSPIGRKSIVALLIKNVPSTDDSDPRTRAYDEIVQTYFDDLTGLLTSHLQVLLPYSSSVVVEKVLSALQPHHIDSVDHDTWIRLCERHTTLVTSHWKYNTSAFGDVASRVLLPALCHDRTPVQPSADLPLVTQGQRFFHEVYSCSGSFSPERDLMSDFQSAIGSLQHASRQRPHERAAYRSAVMFLFKQHVVTDENMGKYWIHCYSLNTSVLVKIIRWLYARREAGDLEAATRGIRMLAQNGSDHLTLPRGWKLFPTGLKTFAFIQANQDVLLGERPSAAAPDQIWQSFLDLLPADKHNLATPEIFLLLPEVCGRDLLAKTNLACIDWTSATNTGGFKVATDKLAKRQEATKQLLSICITSRYGSDVSNTDYDRSIQDQVCATILKVMLGVDGSSIQAHELIKDFNGRKSKSSETRGHFATVTLMLALACQDDGLIQSAFEKILKQSLRDYGARKQCLMYGDSCLHLDLLVDSIATLHPQSEDACLLAFGQFMAQRKKEPDYDEAMEADDYATFVGRILFQRVQAFLDASTTNTTDLDKLLAEPLKVWMQVQDTKAHYARRVGIHVEALLLPQTLTPNWKEFGQWVDRFFLEQKPPSWDFLPWHWKSVDGHVGMEAVSPVLTDLLWSSIRLDDEQESALYALLECCGGPKEGLEVMRKLWQSEDPQLKRLVVHALKELQLYQKFNYRVGGEKPKNLELVMNWKYVSQNFMDELFELGSDGLDELLTKPGEVKSVARKGRTVTSDRSLWVKLCLDRAASVNVHKKLGEVLGLNEDRLAKFMHWGSICPMGAVRDDLSYLDLDNLKVLRILVTSSNPSVAREEAISVLGDGEASASHRHIALNPKTLRRLPPASANIWIDEAFEMALNRLGTTKITTAKALIQFTFSDTTASLKDRVALARRVVDKVQHTDVKRALAGVLMHYFWSTGGDDQVIAQLTELASIDDAAIHSELLMPTTMSGLDLTILPQKQVMQFIQVVVGPVLNTAWEARRTKMESILQSKGVTADSASHRASLATGVEIWTLPRDLWEQIPYYSFNFLLALAFQHADAPGCRVITNILRKGLVPDSTVQLDCFTILCGVNKAQRESSSDLSAFYDWALGTQHRSDLWSSLYLEAVLTLSAKRNWQFGAVRILELLEDIALCRIREYDLVKSVLTTCVRAKMDPNFEEKEKAREVAGVVLSGARTTNGHDPMKVCALEWQVIPLAHSKEDASAFGSADEQVEAALVLLKRFFDDMGGYVCARESIHLYRPFEHCFEAKDPSLFHQLRRRVIEHGAHLCTQTSQTEKDFGYFCLQQGIQWLTSSYGFEDEANQKLVNDMMDKEFCSDAVWRRLVRMNFEWVSHARKWRNERLKRCK